MAVQSKVPRWCEQIQTGSHSSGDITLFFTGLNLMCCICTSISFVEYKSLSHKLEIDFFKIYDEYCFLLRLQNKNSPLIICNTHTHIYHMLIRYLQYRIITLCFCCLHDIDLWFGVQCCQCITLIFTSHPLQTPGVWIRLLHEVWG